MQLNCHHNVLVVHPLYSFSCDIRCQLYNNIAQHAAGGSLFAYALPGTSKEAWLLPIYLTYLQCSERGLIFWWSFLAPSNMAPPLISWHEPKQAENFNFASILLARVTC